MVLKLFLQFYFGKEGERNGEPMAKVCFNYCFFNLNLPPISAHITRPGNEVVQALLPWPASHEEWQLPTGGQAL
jgi:hypothetical protein